MRNSLHIPIKQTALDLFLGGLLCFYSQNKNMHFSFKNSLKICKKYLKTVLKYAD